METPTEEEEELPLPYKKIFQSIALPEEEICLAVSTDMSLNGGFEEVWLVVTGRHILILYLALAALVRRLL